MWHSVVCCIIAHFSIWYRTCLEGSPFVLLSLRALLRGDLRGFFLYHLVLLFDHWPYIVCTGQSHFPLLIFFLKLFSSFDLLLKMFSVFVSSSVIKKLENTKIHRGRNNNDPNSQHSRVNDCSYFGLFILSLSLYLSCVLQYPKKCRFIPTNKLRTVGTTT